MGATVSASQEPWRPGLCDAAGPCQACEKHSSARVVVKEVPGWALAEPICNEDSFEHLEVSFSAIGAVAPGWRITNELPPDGFLAYGGSACVIERTGPGPLAPEAHRAGQELPAEGTRKRVLLALPSWAVDFRRSKWLAQVSSTSAGAWRLCPLRRCYQCELFSTTVLEFELPEGQALDTFLEQSGPLTEADARRLARDLLASLDLMRLAGFTFSGLMGASSVHLASGGRLGCLLPVGCLFTAAGARTVVRMASAQLDDGGSFLAPEVQEAAHSISVCLVDKDDETQAAADAHAAGALLLRACAGVLPQAVWQPAVLEALPRGAADLLPRLLHKDRAWRLRVQDALLHPWVRSGREAATKPRERGSAVGGG